jgi:hypothetical protein
LVENQKKIPGLMRKNPKRVNKYRLKDLLSKLPAKYKPGEIEWGKLVGREVW